MCIQRLVVVVLASKQGSSSPKTVAPTRANHTIDAFRRRADRHGVGVPGLAVAAPRGGARAGGGGGGAGRGEGGVARWDDVPGAGPPADRRGRPGRGRQLDGAWPAGPARRDADPPRHHLVSSHADHALLVA
jgi:hypothetical protein